MRLVPLQAFLRPVPRLREVSDAGKVGELLGAVGHPIPSTPVFCEMLFVRERGQVPEVIIVRVSIEVMDDVPSGDETMRGFPNLLVEVLDACSDVVA